MLNINDETKLYDEYASKFKMITYSNIKVLEYSDNGNTENLRISSDQYNKLDYNGVKQLVEELKNKVEDNLKNGTDGTKEQMENYIKSRIKEEFDKASDYNEKLKKRNEIINDTVEKFNVLDVELYKNISP